MKSRCITFTAPGTVALQEEEVDIGKLAADAVAVRTEASVLSAGTELAILGGTESWAPLPYEPGYGNIGTIIAAGSAVEGVAPGDRVYSFAKHKSVAVVQGFFMKAPADIPPELAVFARMAQVAITSVRASSVELGDTVAVQGLGLVGNFAAQLMKASGATVIGLDVSARRREAARACGIDHVIDPIACDVVPEIKDLTDGRMCEVVVEATGVPDLALSACKLTGKPGEVVLVGSPRGSFTANPVELLNHVHIWGGNNVTLVGAHEWRYPVTDARDGFNKHSIERNIRIIWDLIRQKRLCVQELLSHSVSPRECNAVYQSLRERNEEFLGVVFDWSKT
jgi:threonine dehydrogenase-like Zn-dependent dehydrogenase